MKLVSVEEMQAAEKAANAQGWTYAQMMAQAGHGLAEMVESFYGYEENSRILGLVGSGNNGGDALIALTELAGQGWEAAAYLVKPRAADDPLVADFARSGGQVIAASSDPTRAALSEWLASATVLLDGVLGTGIKLPLSAEVAETLAFVKAAERRPAVVAVDCPSGVDLATGAADEQTIPADVTVCMAAVKLGLLKFPAYGLVGDIQVVEIGLPDDLKGWNDIQREVVTDETVRPLFPERPLESHKGTYGTVLAVAGSINYTGAALLCAKAAARMGAGLVTLAAPRELHAALAGQILEATWLLLPADNGWLVENAFDVLQANLGHANVLLWGPGLGLKDSTAGFVKHLVEGKTYLRGAGFLAAQSNPIKEEPTLPGMVIDADGLKLMARVPNWHKLLPPGCVLTPHPHEMEILCGLPLAEIQADRMGVAQRFAREWGHVLVLKGALTLIAAPDGRLGLIPVATSALAHAGTGDVLAGMIAGLRAQGVAAYEAAVAAAWVHAQCGLLAAEEVGHEASVSASDLLQALPEVLSWVW